ncbi:MAG: hypothetical protein K1060chlam1_00344 [Candidatus Anoxychlamydiales bacterium]|nr:hypothetical protein [Candidatus Anoxychlamydiales bacterium]
MVMPAGSYRLNVTPFEAFQYGVKESLGCLKNRVHVIVFATAIGAGTGYLLGGIQGAWLGAKISSAVFGYIWIYQHFWDAGSSNWNS